MKMINTADCEHCKYGKIGEENRSAIHVYCELKDKSFFYGQRIPCEDKEERKDDE